MNGREKKEKNEIHFMAGDQVDASEILVSVAIEPSSKTVENQKTEKKNQSLECGASSA